ncbi:MAG: hypothetical protein NW208_17570 [Bryobacter sp.]|nr:hypothetical protein [Bryobacter sp.]
MATATRKLEEAALPALVKLKAAALEEFSGVRSLHYSLGEDFFGNPAITVLAVLEDSFLAEAKKLGRTRVDFSDFIRLTLANEFGEADVWIQPYVRLISIKDFERMDAARANAWKSI